LPVPLASLNPFIPAAPLSRALGVLCAQPLIARLSLRHILFRPLRLHLMQASRS